MMQKIVSHSDFLSKSSGAKKSYLLLYKSGSDQSECALRNINDAPGRQDEISIFTADITEVKDIHQFYGITSVPSFLIFEGGKLNGVIKGCQESSYYKALVENALFSARTNAAGKPGKRVTVYSTPTCSWCNTLKTWLRKNNIGFTDVDVSADQNAAEELVRRSGQQGVPQTDINGRIIVGFDQQRLKELLEIQ